MFHQEREASELDMLFSYTVTNYRGKKQTNKGFAGSGNYLKLYEALMGPPLWSGDQSSWLQLHKSGFDSRRYQIILVVGLERGPLSLVSTTEELLERKSSGSGLENRNYGLRGSGVLTTRHPCIRKSWH
jgi:hypothetical protein